MNQLGSGVGSTEPCLLDGVACGDVHSVVAGVRTHSHHTGGDHPAPLANLLHANLSLARAQFSHESRVAAANLEGGCGCHESQASSPRCASAGEGHCGGAARTLGGCAAVGRPSPTRQAARRPRGPDGDSRDMAFLCEPAAELSSSRWRSARAWRGFPAQCAGPARPRPASAWRRRRRAVALLWGGRFGRLGRRFRLAWRRWQRRRRREEGGRRRVEVTEALRRQQTRPLRQAPKRRVAKEKFLAHARLQRGLVRDLVLQPILRRHRREPTFAGWRTRVIATNVETQLFSSRPTLILTSLSVCAL